MQTSKAEGFNFESLRNKTQFFVTSAMEQAQVWSQPCFRNKVQCHEQKC